jgi:rhamnose transport system permease protein
VKLPAALRGFPFWHEAVLGALLVGLLAAAGLLDPGFLRPETQADLSTHAWEMALLAVPMTLVIITAGIDLSVGSTMALCAVTLGLAYEAGWPIWLAAGLALLAGTAAGLVNGLFVAYVRVHPLIITLATLAAYRGIAEGISQGRPISGFPEGFAFLGRGALCGVPVPGLIFALAAGLAALVLARAPVGRGIHAIGFNETAARFSGLPVDRIKLLLYTLCGAAAGLAAVLFVARRNTAKADVGSGMELTVITAVVLGGTSIFGGRGRIAGTVLGLALIHEAREYVGWRWSSDELNLVVVGLLLILSVLLNSMFSSGAGKARD